MGSANDRIEGKTVGRCVTKSNSFLSRERLNPALKVLISIRSSAGTKSKTLADIIVISQKDDGDPHSTWESTVKPVLRNRRSGIHLTRNELASPY